jgi:nicotinate-nucleotide adenylyltransferase
VTPVARCRLGLMGGSFDPIHTVHLRMAAAARAALRLDRVLFVPAGDPWRKRRRAVTPAAHRLAMVKAAVRGRRGFAAADLEVRRPGPTYTVETLEALRAQGYRRIWFILGSDALMDLPRWHEPARLIRLARLALVARPGAAVDWAALERAVPGLRARVDVVEMAPSPVAATRIREALRRGGAAPADIPPAIVRYIREHGLYGVSPASGGSPGGRPTVRGS